MKNILFVFLCAACLCSCNSKGDGYDAKGHKVDTIWNEKIQDTFFGVKFGADRQTVISKLEEQNFKLITSISTENRLNFYYRGSKYFTFSDMDWEILDLYVEGDKFYAISFMNYGDDKVSALSKYNNILEAVSNKYNMTDNTPADTTVYAVNEAFGKNSVNMGVYCYRDETVNKDIKIGVQLLYYKESNQREASPDL